MKLARAEVTLNRGALPQLARNARQQWIEREGLILTLVDESGRRGQGEASPLPGYSPDTLRTCTDALASLDVTALRVDPDAPLLPQLSQCSNVLAPQFPSLRFALECAIADLVGVHTGQPLWALLRPNASEVQSRVPPRLTAMVDSSSSATVTDTVAAAANRGLTSFKLKIGRPGARIQDLEAIQALRAVAGPSAVLRLDANRSLPAEEAPQRLQELAAFEPEFIEEPTQDVLAASASPVALALDESLQDRGAADQLEAWTRAAPITTLVLKPMALGGICSCLRWAEIAGRLGLRVVVSHLLDGPIALGAYAHLALVLNSPETPTGLDHHPGLHAWPKASVTTISGAELRWAPQPGLGVILDPGGQP